MTETLIKLLVVGAVVLAMYYAMSPYQNCLRAEEDRKDSETVKAYCTKNTVW
ncbi:MAG: hypothetical protein ISR36_05690 [Gammaproteobacteria bacterium]|nr:hypothetical protein [Gammaproteobacteria bacterium]